MTGLIADAAKMFQNIGGSKSPMAGNSAKNNIFKAAGGAKFHFEAIMHNDTLDAQLETNNDSLINKILYYLSQLPI